MLSEPTCLPHLANLFLTFDPNLVERTATLLTHIIEENPIMPKVGLAQHALRTCAPLSRVLTHPTPSTS